MANFYSVLALISVVLYYILAIGISIRVVVKRRVVGVCGWLGGWGSEERAVAGRQQLSFGRVRAGGHELLAPRLAPVRRTVCATPSMTGVTVQEPWPQSTATPVVRLAA